MATSLTHAEARERSALISVTSYVIEVDLTALIEQAPTFVATSTIRFQCDRPGSATFVDLAATMRSATLNGSPLDPSQAADERVRLTDLRADNELVITSVQTDVTSEAVHRTVDPTDGLVYLSTSFEPYGAHRAWACFDQPDLKAPHTFVVVAPADWSVVSNSGHPDVTDLGDRRRWTFAATPPLSTYLPVLCAGPFHQVRSTRGGYDLGLWCRQSRGTPLDRDQEELFDLTERGLTFYGEQFHLPFPQATYDQVFVPDMNGAMENYGCVVWDEGALSPAGLTDDESMGRASVLLHEMSHMWFGDLVTMRWWDDLWLNEAFAVWAAHWAAERTTQFADIRSTGALGPTKLAAYTQDMGPTSHPIRQPVPDAASAMAGFDSITYAKGASSLGQLSALHGEEDFTSGLRAYFRQFAWRNAELEDLMDCLSTSSGRDLREWSAGWLGRAGTDVMRLEPSGADFVLTATGPDDEEPPLSHRLDIGAYALRGEHADLVEIQPVETQGRTTPVRAVAGADLLLINDGDLTFASVHPDAGSLAALIESAHLLPSSMSRALAARTVNDLMLRGELRSALVVQCLCAILRSETSTTAVERILELAASAADHFSPDGDRSRQLGMVADTCIALADHEPVRIAALRMLARTAATEPQLDALTGAVGDDFDLRWRLQQRLAEDDRADSAEVAWLRANDPDPAAWARELVVVTARPDLAAKRVGWERAMYARDVPMAVGPALNSALWRRSQHDIAAPLAEQYLTELPGIGKDGMLVSALPLFVAFPFAAIDSEFPDRAERATTTAGVSPMIRQEVRTQTDLLRRMFRARELG